MKLIVGLGNPGAGYARNRHNIGYRALEAIAEAHGFALWRGKFKGQIAEGRLGDARALLLKPETFMNLSGDSVQAATAFHKLTPADVIVLHDELDLAPGQVRVKTGGGAAGHNGLRSIAAHIGPEFTRVRIGIGHPGDKRLVSNYVLSDFAAAEQAWTVPLLAAIARAAPDLAAGDLSRFGAAIADARPPAPEGPTAAHTVHASAPVRGADPAPDKDASPLQRLIDRFR